MRIFSATIIMAVILVSSAFCQVDTLMLVEINSIEVSGEITHLYTESIRDDIQEIFICTQDHIYVYDSQTNELIWSRGELVNPEDLLFEDINNDGFKDLAFRDSLNIFLYDVINSDHIWTSPALDSTYKCYTIGDRNDDGWIDVAIARLLNNEETYYDTVLIELFDNPSFEECGHFSIMMIHYGFFAGYDIENPKQIIIDNFNYDSEIRPYIYIFSGYSSHEWENLPSHHSDGRVWVNDGITLDSLFGPLWIGWPLYHEKAFDSNNDYLLTINGESGWWVYFYDYHLYLNRIYPNRSYNYILWENEGEDAYGWHNHLIGDISYENNGNELCLSLSDSLYLIGLSSINWIWSVDEIPYGDMHIYKSQEFYYNPSILKGGILYNGLDGSQLAFIQNTMSISQISDLNSDGNDELLSIQGNELHIYNLDYYVDVDQPETLPCHTSIHPNYPNPFNSSTTIEYGLKQDEHVTIEIYDLLGRKVETLVDAYQPAGMHRAIWNAAHISTGIYFYKINAGDYSKTRKMLLLR